MSHDYDDYDDYDDDNIEVFEKFYNEKHECIECKKIVYKCTDCYNTICFTDTCKTRYIRSWRVRLDPSLGHSFCNQCGEFVVCSTLKCLKCVKNNK